MVAKADAVGRSAGNGETAWLPALALSNWVPRPTAQAAGPGYGPWYYTQVVYVSQTASNTYTFPMTVASGSYVVRYYQQASGVIIDGQIFTVGQAGVPTISTSASSYSAGQPVTVNFDHIKRHYYMTHGAINPTRIVPLGPAVDWMAPHDRARLG